MRWSRIRLIFGRELRDQLRDRRTLFMIFGLPVLLYPIIGFTVKELTAAFEQRARRVLVIGAEHLPGEPPLLERSDEGTLIGFATALSDGSSPDQLLVEEAPPGSGLETPTAQLEAMRSGRADVVIEIPEDVRGQIERLRRPTIRLAYLRSDEQSVATYRDVEVIIGRWQDAIVAGRLAADDKPAEYITPIQVQGVDLARQVLGASASGGSIWARLFPFLLVMMALTGAFYPAVDLCAGEKERGTMETLLISPAYRSEIVVGKFLTIMAASVATALLNLASMGLTMTFLARQLGAGSGSGGPLGGGPGASIDDLSPPSLMALGWIIVLLIPLSAFFSAICLALAVLARSMKEGQYYMTPLYLIALPLIFLTLMPGVELTPFYSLVPITGVSLLLKKLMLEQYDEAFRYLLPVLMSTIVYGLIALRWAVGQFRSEEVLFREAERFDLVSYARHLVRDRGPTPSAGQAIACFAIILALAWYASMLMAGTDLLMGLAIGQVGFILLPPLIMTALFTSSPRRTLRLSWPGWKAMAIGFGLALTLNPLSMELAPIVMDLFPMTRAMEGILAQLEAAIPDLGTALVLFAVMPAICEEVAFRGYILSGLESGHRRWTAIVLSAVLFGFLHVLMSLFQQLFNATLLGLVLGWMAIRTRSLFPGVLFHITNNALALLGPNLASAWLYRDQATHRYEWPWVVLGLVGSVALLYALSKVGSDKGPKADVGDDDDPTLLAGASAGGALRAPEPPDR